MIIVDENIKRDIAANKINKLYLDSDLSKYDLYCFVSLVLLYLVSDFMNILTIVVNIH